MTETHQVSPPATMIEAALSSAEAKELVGLCAAGRLYAIEKWARAGRSLRVSGPFYQQPVSVALRTGFHSLIEFLLRHAHQELKDQVLHHAVISDRAYINLAIEHGADPTAVPFVDVLTTGNRELASLFLAKGADPTANYPFARALGQLRAKSLLGAYLDCRRARPEVSADLQEQADMALREFARRGDAKWVSLLLWLGANPRSKGPAVEDLDASIDPDMHMNAIEEACESKSADALRVFKVTPDDDLDHLLGLATRWVDRSTITYLLDRGARINDREDGSSSLIDYVLDRMNEQHKAERRGCYWMPFDDLRPLLGDLIERGAIWRADEGSRSMLRRFLLRLGPTHAVELLRLLARSPGAPAVLLKVIRARDMRKHLEPRSWHLTRMGLPLEDRKEPSLQPPSYQMLARYPREKLYEEVWTEPTTAVARRYGISDVALAKACRQLQVPKPPRGYWARRKAGYAAPTRPALTPMRVRGMP